MHAGLCAHIVIWYQGIMFFLLLAELYCRGVVFTTVYSTSD
jgi:hypothetical protein